MKKLLTLITIMTLISFGSVVYAFDPEAQTQNQEEALVVTNPEGQYIGTVANTLVTPSGQILFIILSVGGEPGEQKKEIAIPLSRFLYDQESGTLILNVEGEKLAIAPEFNISDLDDPSFATNVYKFFGEAPSWVE